MPLDRRHFVALGAGALASAALPAAAALDIAAGPLRSPRYDQVRINGGPALDQQRNTLAILSGFDEDALLKPFRAMGGLPAPGRNLGGWYEYLSTYDWRTGDAGLAPGHSFGQWTSAMARLSASLNDDAMRAKALGSQAGLGASITPAFFEKNRFPAYIFDKLNCGLADAHTLLSSSDAFAVAELVRRCAVPNLPASPVERATPWRLDRDLSFTWDESYTLPENLYLLYAAGAGDEYRALARRYLLDSFFDPLSRGENVLGGRHGYSHVNALSSAMQAWFVDGSRRHLEAAQNGFRMLAAQSYATGGWAPDELLETPGSGKLLASLDGTHNSFETPCGTYAVLKLARYLLQATGDGQYGDAMERVLWNATFGALPLQADGRTFYYADNNQNARRIYSAHRWPCCSGTYTQVAADFGINTWLLGSRGGPSVWVNLYLPSTLRTTQVGTPLELRQDGNYPASEHVRLTVKIPRPACFSLHLRIPAWCRAASLRVNGQHAPLRVRNGFTALQRTWRDGDCVQLHLPANLRLEPFPSDGAKTQPDLVALCWGPWVLLPLAPAPSASENELLNAERLTPTEWRVRRRAGQDLYLNPFPNVGSGTYATYIRLT